MKKLLLALVLCTTTLVSYSQNTRITDPNTIGWYALAETYSYGDIPLNNLGKQFTEHRSQQTVNLYNRKFQLQ